ncbi:uracil phosphoribosyltransferase [Candidatus Woesearchaeota archaeon]|nr:uracil phosphoribosyltransferase [Candidatus Woesearchaeota archaeon]
MVAMDSQYDGRYVELAVTSPHIRRLVSHMRHFLFQGDAHYFRVNAREVGTFLAYEAEKVIGDRLGLKHYEIPTVNGVAEVDLRIEEPLLLNILRAANPLVEGTQNVFRQAPVGFMDIKRDHGAGAYDAVAGSVRVKITYDQIPENGLDGKILVAPDIMLASASSFTEGYKMLTGKYGTPRLTVVTSVISAKPGIERVLTQIPESIVVTASIDPRLDARAFIDPGLGDAGDLCYNGGSDLLDIIEGILRAYDPQELVPALRAAILSNGAPRHERVAEVMQRLSGK